MNARRWIVPIAAFASAPALAQADRPGPDRVRCKLSSTGGCSNGVCIADPVQSDFVITFDLKRQRFSSKWGKGRITQVWTNSQGNHEVIVALPPALAQVQFSSDWRTATVRGEQSSKRYTCEPGRR